MNNANNNINAAGCDANQKKVKLNAYAGGFAVAVMVVLLSLSLSHLAHGLQELTGDSPNLSLALAVGIDCGLLCSEVALIVAGLKRLVGVKGWAVFNLITTMVLSATLNSLSYTKVELSGNSRFAICVALGCFIPVIVFTLGKMAFGLFVGLSESAIEEAEAKANAKTYNLSSNKEDGINLPDGNFLSLDDLLQELEDHKSAGGSQASYANKRGIHPSTVSRVIKKAAETGLVRK